MPLPCTHAARLRSPPLRGVDHDRHATDVGLGRDAGSGRGPSGLRNRASLVHVDVDDLRAACRPADARPSSAALELAFLDEARRTSRAGDVGALADIDEAGLGPEVSGSSPLTGAVARQRRHVRGVTRDNDSAIARYVVRRGAAAAADDVQPSRWAKSRSMPAMCAGSSSYSPNSFGRPAFGCRLKRRVRDPRRALDVGPQILGAQRAVQPMNSGCAWRTEFQKASVVWPVSVRPLRSVIVHEIITGRRGRAARSTARSRTGRPSHVQRVENRLDEQQVRAAVDRPSTASA
jgi:hypothetical protein